MQSGMRLFWYVPSARLGAIICYDSIQSRDPLHVAHTLLVATRPALLMRLHLLFRRFATSTRESVGSCCRRIARCYFARDREVWPSCLSYYSEAPKLPSRD